MKTDVNQTYLSAIQYANLGWRCFPIWAVTNHGKCCCGSKHCHSPGKHPHQFAPHGFTQATTDKTIVSRWFKDHMLNLAIATGESSGIVVIDVDAKSGGIETLKDLQLVHGDFPKTPTVKTGGGGYHYFFKFPKDSNLRNSAGKIGKGIDTRAEGGYVVAAPSLHTSGEYYQWVVAANTDIAEMPGWVMKLLTKPTEKVKAFIKPNSVFPIGERNDSLMSIAGSLRRKGLSEDELLPALLKINENRCSTPLADTEVTKIVKSVVRYEPEDDSSPLVEQCKVTPLRVYDTSKFKPMYAKEIGDILNLTIKRDDNNKVTTFLCMLCAYTENSQFNISYNAPSSTGKSYNAIETYSLFPKEDIIATTYCSPTAFFHDTIQYNKATKKACVDLSRKVLIFLEQPHSMLLQRLRSLLSHDEKELVVKITDRNQKFGLKTKTVTIKGYASVIFCSAGMKIDEQEATRSFLLSPDTDQIKLEESLREKMKKESKGTTAYLAELNATPKRQLLKDRLRAIKQEHIREIRIGNPDSVYDLFVKNIKMLKPRHTRDLGRVISLIKGFALLNVWFRDRDGDDVIANDQDIKEAFKIWDSISESQDLGLPPYVVGLYWDVILPAYKDNTKNGKGGLTRGEIRKNYYAIHNRAIDQRVLGKEILPMLEDAGLIIQERDEDDKRRWLVYPQILERDSKYCVVSPTLKAVAPLEAQQTAEKIKENLRPF